MSCRNTSIPVKYQEFIYFLYIPCTRTVIDYQAMKLFKWSLMMKSGCHKRDSLTLLLCVKPVIKVLLRCHRNKIMWQSSSPLWRNDTPPYLSRPSGSLGTVKPEAEHLSGLLGHSNIKCKRTKYWWPSSLPSAAKQEEISNFLQNIWRKGDFLSVPLLS